METPQSTTVIRQLGAADAQELARLRELDTSSPLASPVIGAIVDGRLVAAHSLANGEEIADPFIPTADLRALLSQRARELRGDEPRRGLIARVERAARTHRARANVRFVPGSEHTHLLQRPRGF